MNERVNKSGGRKRWGQKGSRQGPVHTVSCKPYYGVKTAPKRTEKPLTDLRTLSSDPCTQRPLAPKGDRLSSARVLPHEVTGWNADSQGSALTFWSSWQERWCQVNFSVPVICPWWHEWHRFLSTPLIFTVKKITWKLSYFSGLTNLRNSEFMYSQPPTFQGYYVN